MIIHVVGAQKVIDEFIRAISEEAPPASEIISITHEELENQSISGLRILNSDMDSESSTHIPADLALCEDCRRELLNKGDRSYGYPLINCTNCGPRFTIIHGLPYDRPFTTMSEFEMCDKCRSEYENPLDLRFHAQPVACHVCGSEFRFLRTADSKWNDLAGDAVELIAEELIEGRIALIQGVGGFHLACDALNENAVQRLRERKHRERKPLAVMAADEKMLYEYCEASNVELRLLRSSKAPIVLLKNRRRVQSQIPLRMGIHILESCLPIRRFMRYCSTKFSVRWS